VPIRTILVVAPNPELADSLKSGLNPAQFRIVHRTTVEDAEPLLARGMADVCLLDVELHGVQDVWLLERLNQRGPKCPVIVCTSDRQPEWEEEAYLKGVRQVITKPVRIRALEAILRQLVPEGSTAVMLAPRSAETHEAVAIAAVPSFSAAPAHTLLRDFSSILTHSHNAEELLKQILFLLRQIVAVNRAVIFLRTPVSGFATPIQGAGRELQVAASLGHPTETVKRLQLTLDCGLGALLERLGTILRASSDEVRADAVALKEFELLGARVAVPILDRGSLLGVAILSGRITGEPLVNSELELIFHLLEQAGLAVRNIWLHAQQAANHDLLTGVLRELSSACVVVDRNLKILHANKMALKCFGVGSGAGAELNFADIPAAIGTKIYQVLKTGAALAPFRFEPEKPAGSVFQVTIVPFQRDADGEAGSVLLTIEDLTQNEQLRRLELEASDLRLVKNMAHRLVAETGNAIVPLNTFVQIPPDAIDRNLLLSMLPALKETDKRIERRVKQFRYLAEDVLAANESLTLNALLEKAFAEAQHYHPARNAQLVLEKTEGSAVIPANRERLAFAIAEVFMNALMANPSDPTVVVRRIETTGRSNGPMLAFEIQDNGPGFAPEGYEKVGKHFFTTRIPGLGLGLAVARKIIEAHGGNLEISAPGSAPHGVVRVSLPISAAVPQKS